MSEPQATAVAEMVPISRLTPWEDNPRLNREAIRPISESIKRFGFGAVIIARREDGMVIAGHTRLEAAKLLKMEEVPVRFLDLSAEEARALALADNRLGELASWDGDKLAHVLGDLQTVGESIDDLGWSDTEVNALLDDITITDVWKGMNKGDGYTPRTTTLTCPHCKKIFKK